MATISTWASTVEIKLTTVHFVKPCQPLWKNNGWPSSESIPNSVCEFTWLAVDPFAKHSCFEFDSGANLLIIWN